MIETTTNLVAQAKGVLPVNRLRASTKPSPHLYPHQWNRGSAFITIGMACRCTG
jgi:hypothetical protein